MVSSYPGLRDLHSAQRFCGPRCSKSPHGLQSKHNTGLSCSHVLSSVHGLLGTHSSKSTQGLHGSHVHVVHMVQKVHTVYIVHMVYIVRRVHIVQKTRMV